MHIPLGISDFRKLRQEGFDYVDKSLLIKDIIDESSLVVLLPRPRRFGKTLNLSMLRYFLERPLPSVTEAEGENRWALFSDLAIAQAGESYRASFQRFPTIFLTFKDVKDQHWEGCLISMARLLGALYEEHRYLLDGLTEEQAALFSAVLAGRATQTQLQYSLQDLSRYLSQHHQQPVLVLLDEYDTPLHTAHLQGYYENALPFFRTLLSAVFKDNVHLHKGVMTGVLRVAKDNIFTGLNNITVFSLLTKPFATAFGFTMEEITRLLEKAGLAGRIEEVQRWYNGYLFGGQVIYNPWSVLSFVRFQPEVPEPYWANTSSNDLVRELLLDNGAASKDDWEALLRGETIEQPVVESVALRDLKEQPSLLWSLLLFSGYLKVLGRRQQEDGTILGTLAIPNQEVRSIYSTQFAEWFTRGLGGERERREFLSALLRGDAEQVERQLAQWLVWHTSFYDTAQVAQPERFYHGLVLGILVSLGSAYEVRSNLEAGYGRCDLLIAPKQAGKAGVVVELKVADVRKRETLGAALKAAQKQLRERAYGEVLRARGAEPVHELVVAWLGKEVRVALVKAAPRRSPPKKKPGPKPKSSAKRTPKR